MKTKKHIKIKVVWVHGVKYAVWQVVDFARQKIYHQLVKIGE